MPAFVEEDIVMGRRITRRGPWYAIFVALGLLAPIGTMVNVATASDAALHPDCAHLTGVVTSTTTLAADPAGHPIHNVTVASSPDPEFSAGATVQVHAAPYEAGADDIEPGRRLGFAVQPYRMHDPTTGNTTFEGWRLCDAKAGAFWASQEGALGRAVLGVLVFGAAGGWLGFALDPQRGRGSRPLAVPIAIGVGVLLAIQAAAALSGTQNPLVKGARDDGYPASGLGIVLWLLALGLAVVASLRLRPLGSATMVVSGACLLTLGLAQWMVSFRLPLAVVAEPFVAVLFAAAALAGLAAHRSLPKWLPLLFATCLAFLAAAIIVLTGRYAVEIGITYGGVPAVLAACAVTDAVQRLAAEPTGR